MRDFFVVFKFKGKHFAHFQFVVANNRFELWCIAFECTLRIINSTNFILSLDKKKKNCDYYFSGKVFNILVINLTTTCVRVGLKIRPWFIITVQLLSSLGRNVVMLLANAFFVSEYHNLSHCRTWTEWNKLTKGSGQRTFNTLHLINILCLLVVICNRRRAYKRFDSFESL